MYSVLSTSEITAITKRLNFGTWKVQSQWAPMHIADAEGCYFIDGSGKRYLDLSAQLICVNLGYKNKAVIESIERQARQLAYVAPGYTTEVRAELSCLLKEFCRGVWRSTFSAPRARRPMRRRSRSRAW